MKRKNNRSNKISKKTKNEVSQAVDDRSIEHIGTMVGGDHSGWDILIGTRFSKPIQDFSTK